MGTKDTTARLADVCLPEDDGAIEQAFADLDARFSAWSSAVAAVHTALEERAARQTEPREATSVITSDEAGPAVEESTAPGSRHQDVEDYRSSVDDGDPVAGAVEVEDPESAPVGTEAVTENVEEPAEAVDLAATMDEPSPVAFEPVAEADMAGDVPAPLAAESEAAHDQEQQDQRELENENELMASLDPETAAAVRVMRRLNPDRKSLQELIEEYRATHPTSSGGGTGKSKKRSWWSRGNV